MEAISEWTLLFVLFCLTCPFMIFMLDSMWWEVLGITANLWKLSHKHLNLRTVRNIPCCKRTKVLCLYWIHVIQSIGQRKGFGKKNMYFSIKLNVQFGTISEIFVELLMTKLLLTKLQVVCLVHTCSGTDSACPGYLVLLVDHYQSCVANRCCS